MKQNEAGELLSIGAEFDAESLYYAILCAVLQRNGPASLRTDEIAEAAAGHKLVGFVSGDKVLLSSPVCDESGEGVFEIEEIEQ